MGDVFRIPSLEYIKRFFGEILERGSIDRITLADTFGMSHPLTMQHVYKKLREWFPGVPLGLHIHNDFGLATANALMAVACGADEIHCSFNSLGERAGNVATEEVAVALEHLLKVDTGIKLEGLAWVSHMVAEVSKVRPGRNKPIVGDGIFEIESGIVIHILRMFQDTDSGRGALLPYPPELVARAAPRCSWWRARAPGRHYVKMLLAELGIQATDEQVATLRAAGIKDMAIILRDALPPSILEGVIQDVVASGRALKARARGTFGGGFRRGRDLRTGPASDHPYRSQGHAGQLHPSDFEPNRHGITYIDHQKRNGDGRAGFPAAEPILPRLFPEGAAWASE